MHDLFFFYPLSGFIVGLLIGLTGVGGGSLMTPILALFYHVPANIAVSTDLLYAAITKGVGVLAHNKFNRIDWKITALLSAGSIPTTIISLFLLRHYQVYESKLNIFILKFLGLALLLTSITLIFQKQLLSLAKRHPLTTARPTYLTIITGAIIGFLVSFTSVGAGAIGITVLLFLYPLLPTQKMIGSDIAHAVPLTLIAGLGHSWVGTVDWQMLTFLLIGSIPGILIGSALTNHVPEKSLRLCLAIILILVGLKLLFQ